MSIFSERNSTTLFIPKWTLIEHEQRYWFANQFLENKIVVDCASGAGLGTQIYAQSGAEKILAFDISEEAVIEAKSINSSPLVEIKQSTATHLALASQSIDVYVSFETIEHIDNAVDYLIEAQRILKPDGLFICSTPNRNVTNPGCQAAQKPINPFHVKEYSSAEFYQLLSEHFEIIEKYGQNKKPSLIIHTLNLLKKCLPHPLPARIHQVFKVLSYFLGLSHKNGIEKIDGNSDCFEFLIAVCKIK